MAAYKRVNPEDVLLCAPGLAKELSAVRRELPVGWRFLCRPQNSNLELTQSKHAGLSENTLIFLDDFHRFLEGSVQHVFVSGGHLQSADIGAS